MIRRALAYESLYVRRWSNEVLRQLAPHCRGDVANVSGADDDDKEGGTYRAYFTGATSYTITNHVGFRGYRGREGEVPLDLTAPLDPSLRGRFDIVLNHTTLEHIFDVRRAFETLCLLSRDAVLVVVPFSQMQHESESFGDYWRFTPSCLRALFEENGLTSIYEAESPRRGSAVYVVALGVRDPDAWRGRIPRVRVDAAGQWIGRGLSSGLRDLPGRLRRRRR